MTCMYVYARVLANMCTCARELKRTCVYLGVCLRSYFRFRFLLPPLPLFVAPAPRFAGDFFFHQPWRTGRSLKDPSAPLDS